MAALIFVNTRANENYDTITVGEYNIDDHWCVHAECEDLAEAHAAMKIVKDSPRNARLPSWYHRRDADANKAMKVAIANAIDTVRLDSGEYEECRICAVAVPLDDWCGEHLCCGCLFEEMEAERHAAEHLRERIEWLQRDLDETLRTHRNLRNEWERRS